MLIENGRSICFKWTVDWRLTESLSFYCEWYLTFWRKSSPAIFLFQQENNIFNNSLSPILLFLIFLQFWTHIFEHKKKKMHYFYHSAPIDNFEATFLQLEKDKTVSDTTLNRIRHIFWFQFTVSQKCLFCVPVTVHTF